MFRSHRAVVVALLAACALPLCAEEAPPALAGRWTSVAPEAMGPFYGTRDFSFRGDRWAIVFHAYADKDGRQPLFTLRNAGLFALGGPSPQVQGAWEGVFAQNRRVVTADSDAGVAQFEHMGCHLVRGKPLQVMQQPCAFVAPLMRAMGEYDLVALREGHLYFGDRGGDLTKARPDKLTPFPLVKRQRPLTP